MNNRKLSHPRYCKKKKTYKQQQKQRKNKTHQNKVKQNKQKKSRQNTHTKWFIFLHVWYYVIRIHLFGNYFARRLYAICVTISTVTSLWASRTTHTQRSNNKHTLRIARSIKRKKKTYKAFIIKSASELVLKIEIAYVRHRNIKKEKKKK